MKKVAAYCGTRAIYDDMEMSAKSLYANSDVDEIYFFCEDDEWPSRLPEFIKVVNVSDQQFFPADGPNMKSGYTYMAMMRAVLCYLLPDESVVLSLDADLLVEKSCCSLWETDLEGCYYSAAVEPPYCVKGLRYTNVGVTLYNLDMLRDGKADEVVYALNHQVFPNLEQDAFSYLCQSRIHEMDPAYNRTHWTGGYRDPVIIRHFAGYKRAEWREGAYARKWRNMSWAVAVDLHNDQIRLLRS